MEGQFESDKQGILEQQAPPAYSPGQLQYDQPPGNQTIVHIGQPMPSDYFALSIIVTIFCCLPFGIVALVKSSEVRTRWSVGDLAGAEASSHDARRWSFAALFTGIALITIFFVIYFIIFMVALNSY